MTADWVYGSVVLLTLIHMTALAYAYRERDGGESAEEYRTDDGVECPECGAHNGAEFRYCRKCVAELPTGRSFVKGRSGPGSRQLL